VAGRDKLIDAVAAELPRLIAGDDGGFMSRVAHIMNPPKPKPPKPKPKPDPESITASETGPTTEEPDDGL